MRTTPATSRALAVLMICLVSVVLTPASAGAQHRRTVPPAVGRIDRRIAHAQHEIDRWNRRLAHWQVRVSKAAARLQEIEVSPPPPPPPPPTYFTTRLVGYQLPPTGNPLVRAHRRLQRVLRDHRAKEALQQVAAWQGFVANLQVDRRQAIAAARRHRDVALPSGPVTFRGWAGAFLSAIGAPKCNDNELVVVTWETAESTLATYNPLATTYAMADAADYNTTGVKNYVSLAQGLDASRGTLEGGADSYGYADVVRSLQACAPPSASARAIRDSAWCRGCAGGAYVLGLLAEVRGSWVDHAARLIATN
jgi:hypothetical protein